MTNNLHLYQRCIAGNIGGNISAVFIVNTYIAKSFIGKEISMPIHDKMLTLELHSPKNLGRSVKREVVLIKGA